ncbi:uncharacterized protein LOC117651850 isoform X1 [Thrips palmi]|uniref:RING-type E3 ubiquitin transferase n=1 Tax=Thrips palmi TaxID=161013 RepID=A0A6P9A2W4_THRPL|nr:uncharacterized protein LOC117651850 isoform X1 [Thrips palmi]XP_034252176.1 uncharacterized protein LOC117651850 isoform X1 [Thrips palmi]XP_034252177.1 uncharacterized protein LOC117651850 isoform X1 [Thrips palmi]XP_034252178.1 uncharacterized protein LOC117651850 isoform X1 [Thrips palmi]
MVDVGPAGAASSSGSSQDNGNAGEEDKKDERMFECNICLDTAKDAVISMCGHLFCWPCLHQWLETRPARQMCPVCKAAISKEKVIPLYGRGSSKQEDPRNKAPPRPAGQRSEPEANTTEEGQWWTVGEESSDDMDSAGSWFLGNDSILDAAAYMNVYLGHNWFDFDYDATPNESNDWEVETVQLDSSTSDPSDEDEDLSLSSVSDSNSISDSDDGSSTAVSDVVRATHNYWEVEELGVDEASSESGL